MLLAYSLSYLDTHGLTETGAARFLYAVGGFLWPTAIYLVGAGPLSLETLPAYLIVALLNGFLYGILGWCGYAVWELLFGPEKDGWWPSR